MRRGDEGQRPTVHGARMAAIVLLIALGAAALAHAEGEIIVAFGDSITLGPGMAEGEPYPAQLQALLRTRTGDAGLTVINAGIGGNTVLAGLARMDEDVLARKPRFVLIGFGMNDSVMVAAGQPRVPVESFAAKLAEMVGRVQDSGATPVLATITPVVEEFYYERHPRDWYPEGLKPVLDRYSEAIRQVAEAKQCAVVELGDLDPVADIRTPENSGLRDGVHPTAKGYGVIAAKYAGALAKLLAP